ncbi:hypothetical protein HELRODRAFT_163112 [Helobdella robusta]|uniref:SUEL-type lectin domain-containing protein n=1 Tax=Helobdella robusta TaxID=6412 RepID=T1ETN8_HELRO|nr:hypothetical protein HELRODRAFT_163112 [Helobdella robusta]ESN96081.1 hypothetical protein HELRODRAFT_163112 [Helobdella robusta]
MLTINFLSPKVVTEEVCQFDEFLAHCSNGQKIFIRNATYGRMKINKCITKEEIEAFGRLGSDPKYLGCHWDASTLLREQCLLKDNCRLKISEIKLTTGCSPGLNNYLEVNYECLEVADSSNPTCYVTAKQEPSYLVVTGDTQNKNLVHFQSKVCGTSSRPWIIEALNGQKIVITQSKINSGLKQPSELNNLQVSKAENCRNVLGKIKNLKTKEVTSICRDRFYNDPDEVTLTDSYHAILELTTSQSKSPELSSSHAELDLIKIQVLKTDFTTKINELKKCSQIPTKADGCRDIIQPEDTWMQRNGDEMIIGCFMTKQKWYLLCLDRVWSGVIGNCSIYNVNKLRNAQELAVDRSANNEQEILLMVLISGFGIVLCFLIICIGAVCIRKYTIKKLPTTTSNLYNKPQQPAYYLNEQPLVNLDHNLVEEYCNKEFFRPTCGPGEVLLIQKAHYGRMNVGRCLTETELNAYGSIRDSPNFFGCYKDVREFFARECSMRNGCDVKITELENLSEGIGVEMFFVFIIAIISLVLVEDIAVLGLNGEYCIGEIFKPHCERGEVIFIRKAHYGRMNIGRCLTEAELEAYGSNRNNPKFFGCFKDVHSYVAEKCSMKSNYDVTVAELQKKFEGVCGPGLNMHLNVTYSCLKVVQLDDDCEMSASNEVKYVEASEISSRSRCASAGKSFSIEAPRGQNIKMTLQLLHQLEKKKQEGEEEEEEVMCDRVLGTIKYLNKDYMNICSNGFARDKDSLVKQEFVSSSDLIYVNFIQKISKNNIFLIKIEAVGCRDIIQPEDTWMQRSGDEMIIGCFMTKQKWYLRCLDRVWSGVIGNCSNSLPHSSETSSSKMKAGPQSKSDISKKQQLLVIVSICGMGVVACVTIICAGIICLKRCNMKQRKNLPNYYKSTPNNNNVQQTMRLHHQHQPDLMNPVLQQYNTNMQSLQQQQQQQQLQPQIKYNNIREDGDEGSQHLKEEDERYQVLDQQEVARETLVLL